jgi:hypothetical protein
MCRLLTLKRCRGLCISCARAAVRLQLPSCQWAALVAIDVCRTVLAIWLQSKQFKKGDCSWTQVDRVVLERLNAHVVGEKLSRWS